MMGFWLIIPLLLIGVVAYVLGLRPPINLTGPARTGQSPKEILNARYVNGEITREEYDQMCRDLEE